MSETGESQVHESEQVSVENKFELNVEIKGLPYVFRGAAPSKPGKFNLTLHPPHWKEQAEKIQEEIKEHEYYGRSPALREFRHLEGAIGSAEVEPIPENELPRDKKDEMDRSIWLDALDSRSWLMPEEYGYQNAKGIGSFLMDNLCTLADSRGWSIYLVPLNNSGWPGLSDYDLYRWYVKKGFKDLHGSFGRPPQQPDMTQAIAQVLKNSAASA